MVPSGFDNYFMAMAGAGGALIGLLFVAISINPERTFGVGARAERQALAASAFTGLANGFFVSAAGLLPVSEALGPTALTLALAALLNTLSLAARTVPPVYRSSRITQRWRSLSTLLILILSSFVIYGDELYQAIVLTRDPHAIGGAYVLAVLVLVIYALALIRSWELLGAPRTGISGWLNPLAGLEEGDMPPAPAKDPARSASSVEEAAPAPAKDAARTPHTPA